MHVIVLYIQAIRRLVLLWASSNSVISLCVSLKFRFILVESEIDAYNL